MVKFLRYLRPARVVLIPISSAHLAAGAPFVSAAAAAVAVAAADGGWRGWVLAPGREPGAPDPRDQRPAPGPAGEPRQSAHPRQKIHLSLGHRGNGTKNSLIPRLFSH